MAALRALVRGLRDLFRAAAADRDADAEVHDFFERAADELVDRGVTPDAARRRVRLELGSPVAIREQMRESGWEHAVGARAADGRYALGALTARPVFTVVTAVTIALGICAATAMFGAIKPVIIDPLPYPDPERLITVSDRTSAGLPLDLAFGTVREVAQRSRSLQSIAAFKSWQPTLTGGAEPERLEGQRVAADYFRTLGVTPFIGRDFSEADDLPGARTVVMLSDGLWRRRFGRDPQIVGRQIALSDARATVVAILPASFENVAAGNVEIWAPLQYDPTLPRDGREWGHHLRAIARVREGLTVPAAAAELDQLAARPDPDFPRAPWAAVARGFIVRSLQDDVTAAVKPALKAAIAAVVLVLAIAMVNVTNLLLARGTQRRAEIAMRIALGASRFRIVRQLLIEAVLTTAGGGVIALVASRWIVRAIVTLAPIPLPRLAAARADAGVLAFATVVTVVTGVVVGLVPALQASTGAAIGVQPNARSTPATRRTRAMLVVVEVALAGVLLVNAGLLLRSLEKLFAVDPGFDASHVLSMQVQISPANYGTAAAADTFFARALDSVKRVPGVASTGFTTQLPLSGDFEKYGAQFESDPSGIGNGQDGSALRYAVTPGYVETMRIPLRRGRLFTDADDAGGTPVAMINEALAARQFAGGDAIGQRLHLGRIDVPWFTIVGVVGNVAQTSPALAQSDAVYLPAPQWYAVDRVRSLVVRTQSDAAATASAIRQAIWSVDKDAPIVRMATLDELVERTAADRRFVLTLFEFFSMGALLLAAVGIFGVVAGSVEERRREIGIRSALGASRSALLAMVLRSGLGLAGGGVVAALASAPIASRTLSALLFRVSPLDPATYAVVVALLVGVSIGACTIPAWRATRVDPAQTLRAE